MPCKIKTKYRTKCKSCCYECDEGNQCFKEDYGCAFFKDLEFTFKKDSYENCINYIKEV